MTLRWEHVGIPGKALRLPDFKTGAVLGHMQGPDYGAVCAPRG